MEYHWMRYSKLLPILHEVHYQFALTVDFARIQGQHGIIQRQKVLGGTMGASQSFILDNAAESNGVVGL